jgi:hypothetical protein
MHFQFATRCTGLPPVHNPLPRLRMILSQHNDSCITLISFTRLACAMITSVFCEVQVGFLRLIDVKLDFSALPWLRQPPAYHCKDLGSFPGQFM